MDQFSRTRVLLGDEAMEKLHKAKVAVFGIGGVGGYVVEALARSGVGSFVLVDKDEVSESNINRQIIATVKTVGRHKVEVARERILDINPEAEVSCFKTFFLPDTQDEFDFSSYDYIVDAIDTVTGKLAMIVKAKESGTPIISSMGTGNKLNPSMFEVADIYDTSVCPLAKVMRRELKKRNIDSLKVVYSKEQPMKPLENIDDPDIRKSVPGSNAFAPAVAGLIIASEVIKDITGIRNDC